MAVVGLTGDLSLVAVTPYIRQPVYRGLLGGQYVYSVGTAPVGAADVIIVGYR